MDIYTRHTFVKQIKNEVNFDLTWKNVNL